MKTNSLVSGVLTALVAIAATVSLALAFALAMTVHVSFAVADEGNPAPAPTPASESTSEEAPTPADPSAGKVKDGVQLDVLGGLPLMGDDYVWFGRNLELGQHTFKNDIIAAGQVVNLSNCNAAGSIRAAAQDIAITGSSAAENITVAAQNVSIQDSTAKAIAAAGSTVSVSGTCKELTAYAEKVFIDGTVEGDVVVGANTVEVGTNARIKGTLRVSAAKDPVMQRGAEVGDVEFEKAERSSNGEVTAGLSGLVGAFSIMTMVVGVIATLLIAVLAEWLFRRHTAAAANMIRTRTGATIGTGIIAALVAPIAVIILFFLVITIPISIAITLALFAMSCVAGGFAGASLFKLVFPKLGRFACALAGGAIVGVASAIPFLGSLVGAAAFMYLLGYVLQSIFLGMRNPAPGAPSAPVAATYVPDGVSYAPPVAPVAVPNAPNQPYAPAAAPESAPVSVPSAPTDPVTSTGNPPVPPPSSL